MSHREWGAVAALVALAAWLVCTVVAGVAAQLAQEAEPILPDRAPAEVREQAREEGGGSYSVFVLLDRELTCTVALVYTSSVPTEEEAAAARALSLRVLEAYPACPDEMGVGADGVLLTAGEALARRAS